MSPGRFDVAMSRRRACSSSAPKTSRPPENQRGEPRNRGEEPNPRAKRDQVVVHHGDPRSAHFEHLVSLLDDPRDRKRALGGRREQRSQTRSGTRFRATPNASPEVGGVLERRLLDGEVSSGGSRLLLLPPRYCVERCAPRAAPNTPATTRSSPLECEVVQSSTHEVMGEQPVATRLSRTSAGEERTTKPSSTAQPSAGALVRWACRSDNRTRVGRLTLQRMDNVGIVVESLDAAISFFAELGSSPKGEPRSKETGQSASLDCATCASRSP